MSMSFGWYFTLKLSIVKFLEVKLISYDIDYSQVSYRFLALGCFLANLVSDVVCVLFVLRVGSLKG